MTLKGRNYGIDMLRGLAIIGMVLAAVIPWNTIFPGWMYHAQVGPPDFVFNPNNPGITWVDLVFPFFLFSMGAAFPLALRDKLRHRDFKTIGLGVMRRGFLLVFFAITLAYLTPENLTNNQVINYLTSLLAFVCFFLIFMRFEGGIFRKYLIQAIGFIIIACLVYYHSEIVGNTFSKSKNNIIILVLANMAVVGTICWLFTVNNHLMRIAIIIAFMGVWFSRTVEGAWTAELWNFHPSIHWFYNFSYLKYLCIVLPGSILGDFLLQYKSINTNKYAANLKGSISRIVLWCFLFVVFHVVTLYTRTLTVNLIGHLLFGVLFYLSLRKNNEPYIAYYKVLISWGYVLSTIALCFEPIDGGIKKDPSSFSYWFLTSGLSFMFYIVCEYITKVFSNNILIRAIISNGQNPMIAYCVSAFFITPILGLFGVLPILDLLYALHPYLGIVRTIIYMILMIGITNYATHKGWFWRS